MIRFAVISALVSFYSIVTFLAFGAVNVLSGLGRFNEFISIKVFYFLAFMFAIPYFILLTKTIGDVFKKDSEEKSFAGRIVLMSFFFFGWIGILSYHLRNIEGSFGRISKRKYLLNVISFLNKWFFFVAILLFLLLTISNLKNIFIFELLILIFFVRLYVIYFDLLMITDIVRNNEIGYLGIYDYFTGFSRYYFKVFSKRGIKNELKP